MRHLGISWAMLARRLEFGRFFRHVGAKMVNKRARLRSRGARWAQGGENWAPDGYRRFQLVSIHASDGGLGPFKDYKTRRNTRTTGDLITRLVPYGTVADKASVIP